MSKTEIVIKGARTHNLDNIDLTLPRDQFIVLTGLSGSGKSSLAFDTIYAEGQRKYVESLSAYARQFLSMMDKPEVDAIEGLSPAISIEQKTTSHNPRSTVGTVTEIYDYLRLLFARIGTPHCPTHLQPLQATPLPVIVDHILSNYLDSRLLILAPIVRNQKGEHRKLVEDIRKQGFTRLRLDGEIIQIEEFPQLDGTSKHNVDIVIDRLVVRSKDKQRLNESVRHALNLAKGVIYVADMAHPETNLNVFSSNHACLECGFSVEELEPKLFSFNNISGACEHCQGLGTQVRVDEDELIPDSSLTLRQGAVYSWGQSNKWHFTIVSALAEKYDFSVDVPWSELDPAVQELLLNGTGTDVVQVNFKSNTGNIWKSNKPFKGVCAMTLRRYNESTSTRYKEDLSKLIYEQNCTHCGGSRLSDTARHVLVDNTSIDKICSMSIATALDFVVNFAPTGAQATISASILREIRARLSFLQDVGLDYLELSRSAHTLSGGEAQRIRLASQIGTGLVGVLYVLDEPSIGLHQRDNDKLLMSLRRLTDLGNTVLVVEHDEAAMRAADHIVDIGPYAGVHGGTICAQGSIEQILDSETSITANYLAGRQQVFMPEKQQVATIYKPNGQRKTSLPKQNEWLSICGAQGNNLKAVDAHIPLGRLTCVTGVSGSGKSTLINHTLIPVANKKLNRAHERKPAKFDKIEGLDKLDKLVNIDQSPIGRTPRSNPATFTGVFTPIRELFAATPDARVRGYKPGYFSFNVPGGRCEACKGDGVTKVEMHFLPDIYVPCEVCKGARYSDEILEIKFQGANIHEVLSMTVDEAVEFFKDIPQLRKIKTMQDVGLGYISLGQRSTTLSGGEAQRVKLSRELAKPGTTHTLYTLDEPTTGLHYHDIDLLLRVLDRLVKQGNTVIVIEHNLDFVKAADWVIDLGPEGGAGGGNILIQGTVDEIVKHETSHTGRFLKDLC